MVGERATNLGREVRPKAGPWAAQICHSLPGAEPSYFRRWPIAPCRCQGGARGRDVIGCLPKGMRIQPRSGLAADAPSSIGPSSMLPPIPGPSDATDVATAVAEQRPPARALQNSTSYTRIRPPPSDE